MTSKAIEDTRFVPSMMIPSQNAPPAQGDDSGTQVFMIPRPITLDDERAACLLAQNHNTWPSVCSDFSVIDSKIAYYKIAALVYVDYGHLVDEMLSNHPWLKDFTAFPYEFENTLRMFHDESRATSSILKTYISRIFSKAYRSILSSDPAPGDSGVGEPHHILYHIVTTMRNTKSYAQFTEQFKKSYVHFTEPHRDESKVDVKIAFRLAVNQLEKYHSLAREEDEWIQLCLHLQGFCDRLGCDTKLHENPTMAIYELQNAFTQYRFTGEFKESSQHIKQLEADLERQRRDLEQHRRIITCLSFQRILESLSTQGNKENKASPEYSNTGKPSG